MPRRNTIEVIIAGKDKGTVSLLGKVAGGLGGIAKYALGDLLAGGIRMVGQAMGGLAKSALDAVGHAQNLELAMEGLLTESLMYQRVQETTQSVISLTTAEQKRLTTAMQQQKKLVATIAQQEVKLAEAKQKKNESDIAYQVRLEKMRVALEINQERIQSYAGSIANLTQKQGTLATSTEMVWKQTLEYGQANEMAKKEVEGLLAFIEELAITSPFAARQVEEVAKLGLSAKMSTEEVKNFTQAFLDYSAVHGITSENLAFAADQFLQLRKIGKLTAIDMRQLRRLGIDVAQVLGVKMAMSVEEFNERIGESPELMDELFESFIELATEGTAGAAKRMAMTVGGMMATVQDIIQVGSKKLFRPLVEAIGPVMAEVIDTIAGFITGGELAAVGERIGEWAQGVASWLRDFIPRALEAARDAWVNLLLPALSTVSTFLQSRVLPILIRLWKWLQTNLPRAIRILSSFWTGTLLPAIQTAWSWIQTNVISLFTKLWTWLQVTVPGAIQTLADYWTGTLLPATQTAWGWIQVNVLPLLAELWTWLQVSVPAAIETLSEFWTGTLLPALQQAWVFIQENIVPILAGLAAIILAIVVPAFVAWAAGAISAAIATIAALAPVILPLLAIGVVVGLLVAAWQNNWWGIRDTLTAVWENHLKPALTTLWEWLKVNVPAAIQTLKEFWETVLLPAIKEVWAFITETLIPAFEDIWTWMKDTLTKAIQTLTDFWETTLLPAITAVWAFIVEYLVPLFVALGELLSVTVSKAIEILTAIWENVLLPAIKKVWKFILTKAAPIFRTLKVIWEKLQPVLETIAGIIGGVLLTAWETLMKAFNTAKGNTLDPIKKTFDAIKKVISGLIGHVNDFADSIANIGPKLPDWMRRGSPTPLELGLRGISDALREVSEIRLPMFSMRLGQMGGMGETNTNYYFNQTVNTRATQANVMQDWALAQALAG